MRRIVFIIILPLVLLCFELEYLESSGQRRDGSQLFDIHYRISGADAGDSIIIDMRAVTVSGDSLPINTFIAGSDTGLVFGSGEYHAIWNIGVDIPGREFFTDSIDIQVYAGVPSADPFGCIGPYCMLVGEAQNDMAGEIIQNSDGDFVMTGYTNVDISGVYEQVLAFVKMNESREIEWFRYFPHFSADGRDIIQTSDNGYAICGQSGSGDILIVKADEMGELSWYITFGGPAADNAYAIAEISGGDLIIAGAIDSWGAASADGFLTRITSEGSLVWFKAFGGPSIDGLKAMMISDAGNIVAGGWTQSFGAGEYDAMALSTDLDGNLIWATASGGSRSEWLHDVTEAMGNTFVFAGEYTPGATSHTDMLAVKYSATGIMQWANGAGGSNYDALYSITKKEDNNFVACGYTRSYGFGSDDMIAIEISALGELERALVYGSSDRDEAKSIIQTTDGDFMIAGRSLSWSASHFFDMFIVKTFDDLTACCSEEITSSLTSAGFSSTSITSTITVNDYTPSITWNTGYFIDLSPVPEVVCP